MKKDLYDLTLALAGITQSVLLVKEIAETGKHDEESFKTSMYSILQTQSTDIQTIYGNKEGLQYGLSFLTKLLEPRSKTSRRLIRVMLALIHLQKKIMNSEAISRELSTRINKIQKQVDYFHLTHNTVIGNLSDAYIHAIQSFKVQIIIHGTERSLNVNENMNKIRALLLSGIRAAVLWHQLGGSRWQLLFQRSKIREMAKKILTEIE